MESMAYDRQWKKLKAAYEKEWAERPAIEKADTAGAQMSGEIMLWQETADPEKPITSDEFLSGMRKEDKFTPVITIVVYFGKEKPWDGAKTLYELLDVKGDAEKILPFVSNYKLNLFDYHGHKGFGQFHTELQSVFEFLRYSTDQKALADKLEAHKEKYQALSSQAKVLLTKLTNIRKIPDVTEEAFKKGEFDLCKAFVDMKEEGRVEGMAQGIVELGCEFGLSEKMILEKLQNMLNLPQESAAEYLMMFAKQPV